ncbi:hypothetical protein CL616_00275 [archaeon]|nr:hypothetical protein [archaeon]|tara:strand:+ start:450 stop:689 length:240 start_codon:yes stop_codon:yes gene_type:complete
MDICIQARGVSLTGRVWDAQREDLPLIFCVGGKIGDFGVELQSCEHYKRIWGIQGISGRCVFDGKDAPYCAKLNVIVRY